MFYQCEKTHYGKAFPAVAPLKAAVNPKLSLTGKKALHKFNGVPTNYSFYKLKILLLKRLLFFDSILNKHHP
jgi:hypothetical protein